MNFLGIFNAVKEPLGTLLGLALYVLIMFLIKWAKDALYSICEKNQIAKDSDLLYKIKNIVDDIVAYVNQTFVNNAKAENGGKLTPEQQIEAFTKAQEIFISVIKNDDTYKELLEREYGDLTNAQNVLIEQAVSSAYSQTHIGNK